MLARDEDIFKAAEEWRKSDAVWPWRLWWKLSWRRDRSLQSGDRQRGNFRLFPVAAKVRW